jgi:hypothetical protein
MACKSIDTSSLLSNLANWLSFASRRSKKRPFTQAAAFGWETAVRRRAAIRSMVVAAEWRSATRAMQDASAPYRDGTGSPGGTAAEAEISEPTPSM